MCRRVGPERSASSSVSRWWAWGESFVVASTGGSPYPGVVGVELVVLWDIDGTLGHTAGVGARAFTTAIEALFGVTAEGHGVTLAGKTDPQIAREILTVLDLHDDEGVRLSGL